MLVNLFFQTTQNSGSFFDYLVKLTKLYITL